MTYQVEDEGAESGEIGDQVPVRLVHADVVAVGRLAVRRQAPLDRDDDNDGEEEPERPDKHRAGQPGPRDEGRVGLGAAGAGGAGRRDIPQRRDETPAEQEQEESPTETGRAAKRKKSAARFASVLGKKGERRERDRILTGLCRGGCCVGWPSSRCSRWSRQSRYRSGRPRRR